MIEIKSQLSHGLDVPYATAPGQKKKYFHIPPRNRDGTPSSLKLESLDAITLQRLRYNYDWRARDGANNGLDRDELDPGDRVEIGLLTILVDGERLRVRAQDEEATDETDDADENVLDAASLDDNTPGPARRRPAAAKAKAPNKPKSGAPKRSPSEVLSSAAPQGDS